MSKVKPMNQVSFKKSENVEKQVSKHLLVDQCIKTLLKNWKKKHLFYLK